MNDGDKSQGCLHARYIRILLILLPLLFIFTQSMLPPDLSDAESMRFSELLLELFGEGGFVSEVVRPHLRKLAHFLEYAVLGLAVGVIFCRKRTATQPTLYAVFFGLLIALLDETVQIFSGRGSSVKDIWLDFFGYITGFLLTMLVIFLIKRYRERHSDK